MKIKVLIADDHQLFREGLVNLLFSAPDIEVIAQAEDGVQAIEIFKKEKELKNGYSGRVNNVAFSSAGTFATVCYGEKIKLYNKNFDLIASVKGSGKEPYSLSFSPEGGKR